MNDRKNLACAARNANTNSRGSTRSDGAAPTCGIREDAFSARRRFTSLLCSWRNAVLYHRSLRRSNSTPNRHFPAQPLAKSGEARRPGKGPLAEAASSFDGSGMSSGKGDDAFPAPIILEICGLKGRGVNLIKYPRFVT